MSDTYPTLPAGGYPTLPAGGYPTSGSDSDPSQDSGSDSDSGYYDPSLPTGFIVGISIFAVVATILIGVVIWRCRQRKKRGLSPLGGRIADAQRNYQYQMRAREAKLKKEIAKRVAEEQDQKRGTQVWFSRYVQNGRLRHWVLVIDDVKYELRRDDSTGTYVHNVQPWTLDREEREAALASKMIPEVDGYYVCLIGWTSLSSERLRDVAADVMSTFGSYNLLWNNCQTFLKKFADLVVSRHALDWEWFRDNTKTEYQNEQKLPPPPEVVISRQNAMIQNQMQHVHHSHLMQNMAINMQQNQNMLNMSMQTGAMAQSNNIALTASTPANNPAMFGILPGTGGAGG